MTTSPDPPHPPVAPVYHLYATMAHVHGLARAGLLSADEANAALDALAEAASTAQTITPWERGDLRRPEADQSDLADRGGDGDQPGRPGSPRSQNNIAARLEPGRASHDLTATVFRLWTRDAMLDVAELLVELRQSLTDLAQQASNALAPACEPPVLFGHYLMAYVEQLYRDGNRLKEAYVRADILPLGAGDGAGVAVALDRGYVARLLGMHANTRNSLDGVGDRDFAVEALATLALLDARLTRLRSDPVLSRPSYSPPENSQMPVGSPSPAHEGGGQGEGASPGLEIAGFSAALDALSRMPQGHHPDLAKIEAAFAAAVDRTRQALGQAITAVRALPLPTANPSAASALDRFVSRGGTAPAVASAAIADTHGRIDTYRQWIAERRTAHPTIEALRHYPAERDVTLLPHNDPPHPRP